MPARKIGPPCTCKNDCFTKVSEDARNEIFNGFWGIGIHNKQTLELQKRIIPKPIKRKRLEHNKITTKSCTYDYTVVVQGNILTICKKAFMSIYAVKDKRLRVAVKK